MNNTLFQRTGITLTAIQYKILKHFFAGVIRTVVILAVVIGLGFAIHAITPACAKIILTNYISDSHSLACITQTQVVPSWIPSVITVLVVIAFIPFLTDGISYIGRLLSSKDFREKEMAESVDYMEEDEREQLITMRATRRAYMTVNFTLLIFWIVSLVTGDISKAVTLFIVQVIGALSYRREARR